MILKELIQALQALQKEELEVRIVSGGRFLLEHEIKEIAFVKEANIIYLLGLQLGSLDNRVQKQLPWRGEK